ncbi:hypothetical protein Nepgr_013909 [Nepenthes gracilis]|uniref:Uncharacterized protein n=1 Tax=Nepenthes gracilis TaxID=150966 RepID=A0AAD3SIZ2_NEPGR|nr:hypothetical protein Nepgr_013909 [Nepenthes gracilis]
MVSSLKSSSSGNGYHGGRPYAVMLLLAFAAAFLGVLVLHKFRERRILSIVVKEKDQRLIVLHALLQGEQELHRKAKKKVLYTCLKLKRSSWRRSAQFLPSKMSRRQWNQH